MAEPYCVLITSAGVASAVNVIQSLRSQDRRSVRIISGDMNPLAAGLYLSDGHYILPRIDDPAYMETLIDISMKEGAGAVIPIFSREIELIAGRIGELHDAGIGCILPGQDTVRMINDKVEFSRWLFENGFPGPEVLGPDTTDFPVFVKPRKGSSSKGARMIRSREELSAIDPRETIIQQYVPGVEYTIDFLASPEHELMGAVPRERIEVKDGKAVKARTVELPEGIDLLSRIVMESEYSGPGNLQVMKGEDGMYVIELNPRFSAGGLPLATASGPNFPLMLLEMIFEGKTEPRMDYVRDLYMIRYLTEIFLRKDGSGFEKSL
ncbi:MAG: ATP-grasp domain-containing protein [Thermoplasmatota archaeon]